MPLNDNGDVIDGARIDECIDTIKFLLLKNTKIVIISHFQRPGGKVDASMSLLRVKGFVEKKINKEVYFIDNINTAKQEVSLLSFGSIAMLENLRFFPEEELNDDEFAKKLASIGEVYVNDAFSCSHRKHASVHAITKFINSYAGLHLAKEVNALEKLFSVNNKKTNSINALCPDKENVIKSSVKMAIVGGKKISGKIDFINSMLGEMNCIMIGGAMANTFLAASGCDVGGSFFELDMIDMANDIMSNAKDKKTKIVLPIDFVGLSTNNAIETRSIDDSLKDFKIFDIGPKSIVNFAKKIYLANSIFWNGPLGLCEKVDFCIGTVS
uniref:Phosphoglycerate kinase n=1 Tax=Biomphalaria glabrata TaxID=6526 RepID=A0A2C9LZS5_BIOGL